MRNLRQICGKSEKKIMEKGEGGRRTGEQPLNGIFKIKV